MTAQSAIFLLKRETLSAADTSAGNVRRLAAASLPTGPPRRISAAMPYCQARLGLPIHQFTGRPPGEGRGEDPTPSPAHPVRPGPRIPKVYIIFSHFVGFRNSEHKPAKPNLTLYSEIRKIICTSGMPCRALFTAPLVSRVSGGSVCRRVMASANWGWADGHDC